MDTNYAETAPEGHKGHEMVNAVEFSVSDRVATIRLNDPERGNPLAEPLSSQLREALLRVSASRDIDVVVITGAGKLFSVGGAFAAEPDREVAEWEKSEPAHRARMREATELIRIIRQCPQLTIAALNGGAAGAGLALALAADLRVAKAGIGLNTGFLTHALPGELGAIWLAQRLLGPARTKEIFLHPKRISAEEAERIGLVNAVLPADTFAEAVQKFASDYTHSDSRAMRLMKQNIDDAEHLSFEQYCEREIDRLVGSQWSTETGQRRRPGAKH
ncbi:enoyl-CoA hydratase-related protein [Enemella sp. A6]|uniref:enoyl-CoA hydratase-related protein n=1 Tax=Enemella sp. A6 TaxID=3440152 RepID=UPI003EBC119F